MNLKPLLKRFEERDLAKKKKGIIRTYESAIRPSLVLCRPILVLGKSSSVYTCWDYVKVGNAPCRLIKSDS